MASDEDWEGMARSRLEAVVKLDEHGRVVDANRAAESLLGVPAPLAVGRPLADLVAPPESEHVEELRSLLSRRSAREEAHRLEIRHARQEGRERWFELLITRMRERPGATVWLLDVTEEKAGAPARDRLSLLERAERVAEIGSWQWCPETGEQSWSDNLYRLWALEPGEVTPNQQYVMERTHPDDRERMARATEIADRESRLPPFEFRIVQPDGSTRRLRSNIASVERDGDGRRAIVGVIRDVTDEVRADQKIAAHFAVSNALEDWESLEQGAVRLLRDLAEALEFHAGTLWVPRSDRLTARVLWTDRSLDASDFESVTRRLRLRRGVCLPGRVWEARTPINLVDVHKEPSYGRGEAAARAGLRGAVALPALHADEVLAVLELHSRDTADLGGRLMRSLTAIGYELGQFLVHRRPDLDPISLTPRQLEVVRLAAQGLTGREIAQRLFISPTTVKSHFENAYARFGVSDRASAVAEAMRYGFIE
jgi:PAS domain S-box-containing protein